MRNPLHKGKDNQGVRDIVVVGVGSQADPLDSSGVRVAEVLSQLVPRVHLFVCGSPADILDIADRYNTFVVVDSCPDVAAGEVRLLSIEEAEDLTEGKSSTHGLGLVKVLKIARALFPEKRFLIVAAGATDSSTDVEKEAREAIRALSKVGVFPLSWLPPELKH